MILPGRQYEIQLRALVLIDGEQVPSEALSSVIQTPPDSPRDLRVEMNYQKENTITLKWRNPDAPVRDYPSLHQQTAHVVLPVVHSVTTRYLELKRLKVSYKGCKFYGRVSSRAANAYQKSVATRLC